MVTTKTKVQFGVSAHLLSLKVACVSQRCIRCNISGQGRNHESSE